MKQRVIIDRPPVYDACVKVFGADQIEGKPILWAWGDVIFNPADVDIPREILAHEGVHGERQGMDEGAIERWWNEYLTDPAFRYQEELVAHRAEWQNYRKWHAGKDNTPALEFIVGKLASPLYGKLISLDGAKFAILGRS